MSFATHRLPRPARSLHALSVLGLSLLGLTAIAPIATANPVPPIVLPSETASTPVLDEIRASGELRVGIQQDAMPFGYRDSRGNLRGYCLALVELLRRNLRDRLDLTVLPTILVVPSTVSSRFNLIRSGRIQFECGPNTIRPDLEGVTFSTPFFLTGIRLLTLDNGDRPDVEDETRSFGAIADTTTAALLAERYPDANIRLFRGSTATANGVQALQGSLDGYADDEVLLLGEMVKLQLSLSDYALTPDEPLQCVLYGALLPDSDPEWQALVNETLASADDRHLIATWFGDLSDDLRPTFDTCIERLREDGEVVAGDRLDVLRAEFEQALPSSR